MQVNRRHFIGGVVASLSAPSLAQRAAQTAGNQQGSWARRGLVDAGGSHEPYLFVVRRGGQRLDARQSCDYEQSEPLIRQLASQNVEVFHTHFYKGFGMEAEREGMEQTRRAVAIAHSAGMKADTYIQWNTMMYETFFVEEPRAVNWIQRDIAGLPILLTYGYQQSYRYRPCFANQEYIAYLKKIVRFAVQEVKTDFIHFDNFDLNPEPDSCHCKACVTGFRQHLRRKYSAAQLRERFGFERVDYVNPPQWNSDNPPAKMQIIYDPAFQEWIDFRCQLMADALQQMFEFVQPLNPNVALEINPLGITGQNRSWESGIDHARILKYTQAFWSEEENESGLLNDGRLITKIRSYKLARAYNNVLLTYIENNALAMAEALAFNQTLGFVGSTPIAQVTRQYIDFYRSHEQFFAASVDLASVAVLRSYASLTYNNAAVQFCTVLVEQALIEASVPFDLAFDANLNDLSKYTVVILPDTECLSDAQIALLRRFVSTGGSLVVIGQAGLYDEWRRVRVTPGLEGLVDHQHPARDYEERVGSAAQAAAFSTRKQIDRGRVAYLSALEFDGALPPATPNFAVSTEFWKRPKNAMELIKLVHWASEGNLSLSVEAPRGVVATCTNQPAEHRRIVHLVNYNATRAPKIDYIDVSLSLPAEAASPRAMLYAPAQSAAKPLELRVDTGAASFSVPDLNTYAFVVVQW